MMDPILDISGLNLSFTTYGKRTQVLHDVSLRVGKGERVALLSADHLPVPRHRGAPACTYASRSYRLHPKPAQKPATDRTLRGLDRGGGGKY